MGIDTDESKKRRRSLISTLRRLVCGAFTPPPKTNRSPPPPPRTCFHKCLRPVAKPWILSLFVICMFFGSILNGRPRIVEEMHHCLHRRHADNIQSLPVYSTEPAVAEDRLTLMLNSYQRPDLMRASIEHYARCTSVLHEIRVIWCEQEAPPEAMKTENGVPVVYDVMKGTSLNNRFAPIDNLQTEVVMSIDDDIYAPCSDLHKAFKVWEANKRSLVGFFPRGHKIDEDCIYNYFLGTKTYVEGRYSMLLTKAALFHRDYLTIFTEHMPERIRDYVDDKHNCEDIAMQLLIANYTSEPAKFVNSPWMTDSGKGPFKLCTETVVAVQYRTECLNDLVKMFNHVPLISQPLTSCGEMMLWIRISPIISFFINLF